MSRIYFHSEHETAEVSGRERASMGTFCGSLLIASLRLDRSWPSEAAMYRRLLPPDHYTQRGTDEQFLSSLQTWLYVGDGQFGVTRKTDAFTCALNTAIVLGGDTLKLMARLHGQCEIYAFVEGPHRAWLADIIERGRASKLLRSGQGWESVVAMLRSRSDGPVVTSYSVCQSFPNATVAGWKDDEDGDGFYKLSETERWTRAMDGLRASKGGLELTPENWNEFYFRDSMSGFDVMEELTSATERSQ